MIDYEKGEVDVPYHDGSNVLYTSLGGAETDGVAAAATNNDNLF